MNSVEEIPAPVTITDSALSKIRSMLKEEGNPALKLRIFVTGGGCSGFQYGFSFEEEVNEDDTSMQKEEVTILIDPVSLQYMVGAAIDYTENLHESRFIIRNPNATTTCGCGSSFTPS